MIRMASQRAIDRTWRVVAPVSRRSASSRRRRSAIMISVLTTAIDVKAKSIATERAEPVVQFAVAVGRGDERGAVAHLESGVSRSQRPQARGRRRWLVGLDEVRAEQRGGQVTGGEFGGEQRVPEGQIAGVDRHDGGVGARAVAQHDRHAVADAGVRGVGAVAPERDGVAVQGAQGPRDHPGVEAAALPSGEDLGGEGVIGAEARAERGGRQRDRRTYSGRGARVGQHGGREARPGAGDGELARQRRLPLLGGGVVDAWCC